MPVIYPSTALKTKQREVKSAAEKEIVYITENGWGKYVFMSENILKNTIEEAVQEALYEKRLRNALAESRKDIEEGRYYSSREEMLKAADSMREERNAPSQIL